MHAASVSAHLPTSFCATFVLEACDVPMSATNRNKRDACNWPRLFAGVLPLNSESQITRTCERPSWLFLYAKVFELVRPSFRHDCSCMQRFSSSWDRVLTFCISCSSVGKTFQCSCEHSQGHLGEKDVGQSNSGSVDRGGEQCIFVRTRCWHSPLCICLQAQSRCRPILVWDAVQNFAHVPCGRVLLATLCRFWADHISLECSSLLESLCAHTQHCIFTHHALPQLSIFCFPACSWGLQALLLCAWFQSRVTTTVLWLTARREILDAER